MNDPKIKYVLLLPLRFNNGKVVSQEILDGMLDEIFVLSGGYSIAGVVRGAYRMADGTKQEDESWQVWIGIREEEIHDLENMVAKFGKVLGQETMYLERTGGKIGFVAPCDTEGEDQ